MPRVKSPLPQAPALPSINATNAANRIGYVLEKWQLRVVENVFAYNTKTHQREDEKQASWEQSESVT